MGKQGFGLTVVIIIVAAVLIIIGGLYYFTRPAGSPNSPATSSPVASSTNTPSSTMQFTFNNVTYQVGDRLPDAPGKDYTSESYEWITAGETLDNWTTLITTHKLTPSDPATPLSAPAYAQNVAALQKNNGAIILETSVVNTSDAKAAGIDTSNPPYLIVYIFPSSDGVQPAELDIQKIQDAAGGGLTSMIYAEHLNITTDADLKAFLASPGYAEDRKELLLTSFPY